MSKIDRIMLRFRPIAPKPVTGSPVSGGSSSETGDVLSKTGRSGKRKFQRVQNNNSNERCNRRKKYSPKQNHMDSVITLPLLPETPDPKDSPSTDLTAPPPSAATTKPIWLSFENHVPPVSYPLPATAVARSCVTVECVTETWVEGNGLGSTDEERRENLRKDTCPGFVSDAMGRVTWTNGSYRRMVGLGLAQAQEEEVGVRLVMKEKVMMWYPSFTCRVKVQYTCGKESGSLTLPCDVWRMDSGGFAWRLDVKAALSLSLLGR